MDNMQPANNINQRAIAVQQADGIDVGPDWWQQNVTDVVGNGATEDVMFAQFMKAYDRDFPKGEDGKRHPVTPGS